MDPADDFGEQGAPVPPPAPPPAPVKPADSGEGFLALTRRERQLLALLLGSALGLTGIGYWREHRAHPPELVRRTALVPVNINEADVEELELLRGVGSRLASRIVAEREAHGPYRSIWELSTRVAGIDRHLVQELAPQLTTGIVRTAENRK